MSELRASSGASILPQLLHPGQTPHAIILWDTSDSPATNDRYDKLGNGGGQLGAAVGLFDEDSLSFGLVDGYHGGQEVTSLLPFEPDNWNPRFHDGAGGRDSVWSLRNICDHTNDSGSQTNRSTHWIDQELSQVWALSNDLMWVVPSKSKVSDETLHYTAAGFLEILSGAKDSKGGGAEAVAIKGGTTRGALALSVARNTGHVADSSRYAHLNHCLVFLKPATKKAPPPPSRDVVSEGQTDLNNRLHGGLSADPVRSQIRAPNAPGQVRNFQIRNGQQISSSGQDFTSQTAPPEAPEAGAPEGEGQQESELGLRLDTGWLCDKAGAKVARFTDEQPPSGPKSSGDEVKLVTFFVMDAVTSPDDKLDNDEDDNSNHKKLPKTVKKKKFAGWVKVPKPGSENPTYDYSYHSPPPGSSSSSSSSSSGGGSSSDDGSDDGSGQGSTTPEAPYENPETPDPVPSVDDAYTNPDGTPANPDPPSTGYDTPSKQVQHGFAPPRSPGYSMRGNILPKIVGANPVGSWIGTKAADYRNVIVELIVAFSDDLLPNQVIELNVIVGAHAGKAGPSTFYRRAFVFNGNNGWVADPREYKIRLPFTGFTLPEQMFTILVERRNDTDKGTNSNAELCILRSTLLSD
jgi:hypothetical protein